MRKVLLAASLLTGLGAGAAMAQPPPQAGQPAPQAPPPAVDRVPENATNGAPGSANSPKPDANVPAVQTPPEPPAAPKP